MNSQRNFGNLRAQRSHYLLCSAFIVRIKGCVPYPHRYLDQHRYLTFEMEVCERDPFIIRSVQHVAFFCERFFVEFYYQCFQLPTFPFKFYLKKHNGDICSRLICLCSLACFNNYICKLSQRITIIWTIFIVCRCHCKQFLKLGLLWVQLYCYLKVSKQVWLCLYFIRRANKWNKSSAQQRNNSKSFVLMTFCFSLPCKKSSKLLVRKIVMRYFLKVITLTQCLL
eukprot:TRINITY_DN3865_c1_g1_i2.p1 TRINITY_DN3865_c1_g1~~TRINITY_DN3865_c1_g1_i2.p1  ORF type:complete len:225 (-),score=-21.30 TRINITY_DN3865_c1_g1_i2:384-1058(-)